MAPGARVVRTRILPGGGWLATHALDVVDPGGHVHEVVLRRWARPGWQLDDPLATPAAEARTLDLVGRGDPGLPVPRVVAVDPDGRACDVPALLATRLTGRPPALAAWRDDATLRALAAALVRIQALDGGLRAVAPRYYAYYRLDELGVPALAVRPDLWERAVDLAARVPPPAREAFIHRDFHPGNTLWAGQRLTGIVDWTAACWGAPGADLGHLLANLGVRAGPAVAERAARLYRDAGGDAPDEPWWRVRAFLDFAGRMDGEPPRLVRAAERYLAAILQRT